jgi:transketolase
VILIATGSEVALALAAHEELVAGGVASRVVSLPSWWAFEREDPAYRDSVLPPGVTARVAIEQASPLGWERWTGSEGEILAMRSFGASGPYRDVEAHFGFTVENVVAAARRVIA